jgi:hypothetical protein
MRCDLEWKTSSARYPEERDGIAALDPQLVCYSWMTGIDQVAQVVFEIAEDFPNLSARDFAYARLFARFGEKPGRPRKRLVIQRKHGAAE